MIPRMDVADVGRLYAKAAADNALIEIELDTQQLRAISDEEAEHLMDASSEAGDGPQFNRSLEALLRLSWPVWKANA